MELDDFKKSWNAMDDQLKERELIKDENISKLIDHAKKHINEIGSFNQRVFIGSTALFILLLLLVIYDGMMPSKVFLVTMMAAIPAMGWDSYTAYHFKKIKIEELPLAVTIARVNNYYRWMIRERIVGLLFIVTIVGFFFFEQRIWQQSISTIILFLILWMLCLALPIWVYRRNIGRLKEIKKNLDELKENNAS